MSEKPVRRWQLMFDEFGDGEMVKHDKGLYVALEDYVALERKTADLQRRVNELSAMIHPVSLKAYMTINNIENNFNPTQPNA